ncbi:hypothetical protein GLYMA_13G350900v4 [Glycine max]|uniref:Uncharacterized protein n=1 Tax=Glycine max TaxID=3847 RepID=K7M3P0_SOYBN|nr:hypothetical protein JHK85_038922 [Glycine max]KAH1104977.1 hypothetical protein GYH30_038336 [Glycine max]KRH23327.1 hypothetical protein GLYMA_13G350900v4 [Glycine max]
MSGGVECIFCQGLWMCGFGISLLDNYYFVRGVITCRGNWSIIYIRLCFLVYSSEQNEKLLFFYN